MPYGAACSLWHERHGARLESLVHVCKVAILRVPTHVHHFVSPLRALAAHARDIGSTTAANERFVRLSASARPDGWA